MSLELRNSIRSNALTLAPTLAASDDTSMNVLAWDTATKSVKVSMMTISDLACLMEQGPMSEVNLSNYLRLDTQQIVSGQKSFANQCLRLGADHLVKPGSDETCTLVVTELNGIVNPTDVALVDVATVKRANHFEGVNTFGEGKLVVEGGEHDESMPDRQLMTYDSGLGASAGTVSKSDIRLTQLARLDRVNAFEEGVVVCAQGADDAQSEARKLAVFSDAGVLRRSEVLTDDVVTRSGAQSVSGVKTFAENALRLGVQVAGNDGTDTTNVNLVTFGTSDGRVRRSAVSMQNVVLVNKPNTFLQDTVKLTGAVDASNQSNRCLVVYDTTDNKRGVVRQSAIDTLTLATTVGDQRITGAKTFEAGKLLLDAAAVTSAVASDRVVVYDPVSGAVKKGETQQGDLVRRSAANTFTNSNTFEGSVTKFTSSVEVPVKKLRLVGSASAVSGAKVVVHDASGLLSTSELGAESLALKSEVEACATKGAANVFTGSNTFMEATMFHDGKLRINQDAPDAAGVGGGLVVWSGNGALRLSVIATSELATKVELGQYASKGGMNEFAGVNTFTRGATFSDSATLQLLGGAEVASTAGRSLMTYESASGIVKKSVISVAELVSLMVEMQEVKAQLAQALADIAELKASQGP